MHADRPNKNSRLPIRRVLAATAAALMAGCQPLPPERAAPTDGKTLVIALDSTSEHCLQQLYLRCSSEAMQGWLSSGGIAACSVVYETLLKRSFGGDFHALLRWSRQQPDDAAEDPGELEDCWPNDVQPEK